jgi:lysophospholipase L1-like esterase
MHSHQRFQNRYEFMSRSLTVAHTAPSTLNAIQFKAPPFLRYLLFVLIILCAAAGPWNIFAASSSDSPKHWVGTWSAAPQIVEQANMPPSPGLTNNSLRQILRVSIGGDSLRVKLTNDSSAEAISISSATIAVSTGGSAIDEATIKNLRFGGTSSVTIGAHSTAYSDPVKFEVTPRMTLAITLYFGKTPSTIIGHPGSRTGSFLLAGDQSASVDFSEAARIDHWYVISTVEVWAPASAAAVAILGNSITDGRGSITDLQNRWPDVLSERLIKNAGTEQVAVLNQGIGGNCVLSGGLGPTGVSRFKRDILDPNGVKWAIIFEGVNDIGSVKNDSAAALTATQLVNAFTRMIADAHAKNLKVYGATIMPFGGHAGYANPSSEACRQRVNHWIRTGGFYDAVIDFDKITRSSSDSSKLGIATHQNDGLHPTADGYKLMGESIDLKLFVDVAAQPKLKKEKGRK